MASTRKSPPSNSLLERVSAVLGRHVRRGDRLVAGFSGGIDSVVMLDALRRAQTQLRFELAALHVNHQINLAAAEWARFCRRYCRQLGVPLTVVKVTVPRVASLEAAARTARYAAFAALPADFVVLAHHLDDQAETMLLQLLRGAGVKGLSAMPEIRSQDSGFRIQRKVRGKVQPNPESRILNPAILRPLLDVSRADIETYARSRKLKWVDDDSNADIEFDRNFLRHRLLPVIAERYPAYRTTLARSSRNFAGAAELLDDLARIDAQIGRHGLKLAALLPLTPARARNAVRFFLATHDVTMPNEARLVECVRQIQQPRASRLVIDLGTHELRGFGGELRIVAKTGMALPAGFRRSWQGQARLALPELGATLVMKKGRGSGISWQKLAAGEVTVRLREGGERLRPDARRPRRSLKNLLQEAKLPPWLRGGLPLLFCGDALVYVPGIGIDVGFQAQPDERSVAPQWVPQRAPIAAR